MKIARSGGHLYSFTTLLAVLLISKALKLMSNKKDCNDPPRCGYPESNFHYLDVNGIDIASFQCYLSPVEF